MTRDIMPTWISYLNEKLMERNRKIIIFMDSATSHPQIESSKIQIVFFLAPNTKASIQRLD